LNRANFLRVADACDARSAGPPQTDAIEGSRLVLIGKHQEWRRSRVFQAEARRIVVERDELIGIRVRQGLEENAVDDAEDRGIGPDADPQCEDGHGGEDGELPESAEDVPESHGI
jgi:hypothetical protein